MKDVIKRWKRLQRHADLKCNMDQPQCAWIAYATAISLRQRRLGKWPVAATFILLPGAAMLSTNRSRKFKPGMERWG